MTKPPEINVRIEPRSHFRPYLLRKQKRASMVCHRRAGKTVAVVQDIMHKMLSYKRKGPPLRYAYVAPTRDQAKDIAWEYVKQYFQYIPGSKPNEADLQMRLANRATLRLYSGDAYERMRGLYFDGVVLDEYADIDPLAWERVILPCLTDYHGWATFIGTPKGRNAFHDLHQRAEGDDAWYSMLLRASESGILSDEVLAEIAREISEDSYRQEYECDWDIGRPGAIFAKLLSDAIRQGRVSDDFTWRKEQPVFAAFDFGAALNQRCVIFQTVEDQVTFLASLNGSDHCNTPAEWTKRLREMPYEWGALFLPHDGMIEFGGQWEKQFREAGMRHIIGVPKVISIWDRISPTQSMFPRLRFREESTVTLRNSLAEYHSVTERDGISIRNMPVHDWSSHGCDALTYACQAVDHGLCNNMSAIAFRPQKALTEEPEHFNVRPQQALM